MNHQYIVVDGAVAFYVALNGTNSCIGFTCTTSKRFLGRREIFPHQNTKHRSINIHS